MPFDIYDFTSLTQWIDTSLRSSMSPAGAVAVEFLIVGVMILLFYAVIGLFLVYAERKVCAFMQNRLGPNRVGPFGMFQTIADLVKLLLVELVPIRKSDKFLFNLAPFIVITASFMAISAIPFAKVRSYSSSDPRKCAARSSPRSCSSSRPRRSSFLIFFCQSVRYFHYI